MKGNMFPKRPVILKSPAKTDDSVNKMSDSKINEDFELKMAIFGKSKSDDEPLSAEA
jgi:hypothetical protein